jgi:hypothetical protein
VQDGRIYIERVNAPFLAAGGSGDEFRAGIAHAIAQGWLWRHESGTYLKFTEAGLRGRAVPLRTELDVRLHGLLGPGYLINTVGFARR